MRHFETAIELNPEYARGYNILGNALQASARTGGGMAQMERAAELHLMATQLQPAMASAYNSLGNAQRALDNPEAAVRALSVAVGLSGSGTHYSNLGAASLQLHRLRIVEAAAGGTATAEAAAALEATLRWLRVAERLSPTDSNAANNLAAALEADGQLGGARQVFERLLETEPGNALLMVHRANVLKGQGLLHEAVHAYTTAIHLHPDAEEMALAYNNLGGSLQARLYLRWPYLRWLFLLWAAACRLLTPAPPQPQPPRVPMAAGSRLITASTRRILLLYRSRPKRPRRA